MDAKESRRKQRETKKYPSKAEGSKGSRRKQKGTSRRNQSEPEGSKDVPEGSKEDQREAKGSEGKQGEAD